MPMLILVVVVGYCLAAVALALTADPIDLTLLEYEENNEYV